MILWKARFREIRHDQIANHWAPRINVLLSTARGEIQGIDYVKLLESFAPEWTELCEKILALLEDLEIEMTPVHVFDNIQLQNYDRCAQDWMRLIVHNLWIARCRIRQSIPVLVEELSATESIAKRITYELKVSRSENFDEIDISRNSLRDFKEKFLDLRDTLNALEVSLRDIGLPRYR